MSTWLTNLLKEPFGPYLEEEALTVSVPNTTQKNVIALECLLLEGNGRITGLDECEPFQPEYNKKLFQNQNVPVRFHGVLEIQRLTWLTPEAVCSIEAELRERDLAVRAAVNSEAQPSALSLQQLYRSTPGFAGGQVKIKVKIQGTRTNTVVYLHTRDVPQSLLLTTKNRRYAVNSMHINTYELSRRYLSRYHLHYTLRTLLALDAGTNTHATNRTRLEKRTPEWFINLYFKHAAYLGAARQHRPLYADSDSDIEPNTDGRMKPGREHTLRHVSRAEMRSLIAEHAQWLIDEQRMNRKGKWIDVNVWSAWLSKLQHRSMGGTDAAGRAWAGHNSILNKTNNLGTAAGRRKPASRKNKYSSKTARRGRATSPAADIGPAHPDAPMISTYDPDFSPASTTLGSPISSPSRPSTPTYPDLLAQLPSQLWHAPNVNALLIWTCPWEGCSFLIDLLHPREEDMDHPGISEEDKERFRRRTWTGPKDVRAREAFMYMVDKHHEHHFDELGIELVTSGEQWHFRWKNPAAHPRPKQFRQVGVDDRRLPVKQEE